MSRLSFVSDQPRGALIALVAGALLVGGFGAASAAPGDPPSGVVTVNPTRILDTRTGLGVGGTVAPLGAGQSIDLAVGGQAGVPVDATGVVANVTVTGGSEPSYLTVWPTGEERPLASSLNVAPDLDLPNTVTIELGADGKISVLNYAGTVDVVADVTGYLVPGVSGPQGPQGPQGPPGPAGASNWIIVRADGAVALASPKLEGTTVVRGQGFAAGYYCLRFPTGSGLRGVGAVGSVVDYFNPQPPTFIDVTAGYGSIGCNPTGAWNVAVQTREFDLDGGIVDVKLVDRTFSIIVPN